jgi:hypothetical protein
LFANARRRLPVHISMEMLNMPRSGPAGIHCYHHSTKTAHSKFAADNQGLFFEAHSMQNVVISPTRPLLSYLQVICQDAGSAYLKQEKGRSWVFLL